ncbi:MAG: hypothetical protein H6712_27920 [Myxococcales bacterium]|nr:hypothetical protein [Myxococcales bacterium]MCB9717708.1 hypothetical protein [Myxococcales bacterium]
MPMLADIDDPPRSRLPGLVIGGLLALPLAGVVLVWLLPTLVEAVLGGSQSFDDRLALETAYMDAVCTQAIELPRDEGLCECVLATEHPGIDCQAPFLQWSLDRQMEHCADPDAKKEALSFCTCVDAVNTSVVEAPDQEAAQTAAQAYRNCQELPDAVYLPTVEALLGVEPAAAPSP